MQPDSYGVFPDGRVLCVQVHCSNKPSYEVGALVKLCSADAVDLVLVVARTKKDAAALKLAIDKHWVEGTLRKYLLINATDCLEPEFDWRGTVEQALSKDGKEGDDEHAS